MSRDLFAKALLAWLVGSILFLAIIGVVTAIDGVPR